MQFIAHRINTVRQLAEVPREYGIELDIRYHENRLVLHHDPFRHHERPEPEFFENLLAAWKHVGPMILNVKTEGVEKECIALMNRYGIPDWFFLDLSMPYFVQYSRRAAGGSIDGFTCENLAVRFSECEPLEYALAFSGMARWVWCDCFTRMPLDVDSYVRLRDAGFRICLVSPELQGHPAERIAEFQAALNGMDVDAVCTKRPELWLEREE